MLLLIVASLFSKAQSDQSSIQLIEVDALIEERRINEALALVEEYIRENPTDFDNAQQRIDIIFKSRNEYKAKADELVRILVDDPLNDKLKLDIIAELESMETNPNLEEREFIANIKITSQFTYFKALYEQIIADGTELLDQKDYTASAKRFTDGFELYYDDFFERGFESELIQEVVSQLDVVYNSISDFESLQLSFISAFEQYNLALQSNNIAAALTQYQAVAAALDNFASVRNESILAGLYFEEQALLLQEEDPELTDAFFLAFAYRLLLGRGNDSEANIVKAMDTQWNDMYEQTKLNLSTMIAYYSNILNQNLMTRASYQIAQSASNFYTQIDNLQSIISMGQDFLAQFQLLHETQETFIENPYTHYASVLDFNAYLAAETQSLVEAAITLSDSQVALEAFPIPQDAATAIQNNTQTYTGFLVSHANNAIGAAQTIQSTLSALESEHDTIDSQENLFSEAETIIYPILSSLSQSLNSQFRSLSVQNYTETRVSWETISAFLAQGSSTIRNSYDEPYAQAIPLINEALDITVQSNPRSALTILTDISNTIEGDIAALQVQYDFLETVPEEPAIGLLFSDSFLSGRSSIQEDITHLTNLTINTEDYIVLANQRIRLAQQAQNEAVLRFTQAQDYLDQENFAASRDSLQRSRTKYNEALAYQYTDDLLAESDELLAALGSEISFTENEIVVRNVRNFITQSRNSYYNSDFSQAEALILQAEAQWASTNIQENPEVVTLKALIGNALSITTGRTIPSTDPLYPEMSQTLNVAYQHYDNAENLLSRNNREQALGELELARNKIRDVQVLYPFHQEASLLALQIDELIDPVAFQEQFTQKFQQAQADYRSTATSSRAYIDLLDLYEINPNYPGLEDFIYVVELELGIILPPPNLAAISQSDTLTREAENIYDSGARDEITLNNALALLSEAIDLNADNQDALILLDRINTSLGGAAVIVLSSEAENLYQQAVQELSNGNTITAAALVTQLLQLPGVENSSKIIDLQRRVESLL